MDWLEITVEAQRYGIEAVSSALEDLGVEGLVINDPESIRAFLDGSPEAWDYVEEGALRRLCETPSVQFYVLDGPEGRARLAEIEAALPGVSLNVRRVRDEDWLNAWKAFFKPIEVGRRLLIVPAWEKVPETDRVAVLLEPQHAFGTGEHITTRLCLEEIEKIAPRNVLDLGCGSGILAIASVLLGAKRAVCCDISPDAAKVCRFNAALNGIGEDRLCAKTGDVLLDTELDELAGGSRYDAVFANIVADVIIRLLPRVPKLLSPEGVFICSGVIDGREGEVVSAIEESGLRVVSARRSEGWHVFAAAPGK